MCAMIYRHRPILSALIAAGLSCVAGVLLVFGMRQRYEAGVAPASSVMLAGCVTIVLTGSFLIVAFSRYRSPIFGKHRRPPIQKNTGTIARAGS